MSATVIEFHNGDLQKTNPLEVIALGPSKNASFHLYKSPLVLLEVHHFISLSVAIKKWTFSSWTTSTGVADAPRSRCRRAPSVSLGQRNCNNRVLPTSSSHGPTTVGWSAEEAAVTGGHQRHCHCCYLSIHQLARRCYHPC